MSDSKYTFNVDDADEVKANMLYRNVIKSIIDNLDISELSRTRQLTNLANICQESNSTGINILGFFIIMCQYDEPFITALELYIRTKIETIRFPIAPHSNVEKYSLIIRILNLDQIVNAMI